MTLFIHIVAVISSSLLCRASSIFGTRMVPSVISSGFYRGTCLNLLLIIGGKASPSQLTSGSCCSSGFASYHAANEYTNQEEKKGPADCSDDNPSNIAARKAVI